MAVKPSTQRPIQHRYNEVAEALVPDPSQVPDLRVLVGMLGRSNRPGHSRLYLTIDLCDYLEVADDDIVHVVSMDTKSSPLGANIVWLKREAKYLRTRWQTQAHADDSDGFKVIDLSYHGKSCNYVVDKVHL